MTDLLEHAIAAHRAGQLAEAQKLYIVVLKEQPDRADARHNLGVIYGQQGRLAEAVREFAAATEAKPDFGEAWLMLSECAGRLGQHELGLKASAEAARLLPTMARAWLRHGLALNQMMRDEEAADAYRRAVEIEPSLTAAWINLCVSLKLIGQPDDAEAAIREAIARTDTNLDTDDKAEDAYNLLHWHLALLELATGDWTNGFAHFRARFKGGTNWKRFDGAKPLWRGESLEGKTLLITAEQGHGDLLMMARYLPELKRRGATIIFQTHPALTRYFSGWSGADEMISTDTALDKLSYDFHAPIFDLPYRFATTPDSIPAAIPYLPMLEPDEATRLPQTEGRRVGIIWAGQPHNPRDTMRSVPATAFAALFSAPGCRFFNLTRETTDDDRALLARHGVTDLSPVIHDFADVARILGQLDLLVTCDTAAAHLAGGMGKMTYVLLPFAPDWRWGFRREDCPWYPTMRLFRQQRRGAWGDVLAKVESVMKTS